MGFAWSYSALKDFEVCPERYRAYRVDKEVREPETRALREGNHLHRSFDDFLSRGIPLPAEFEGHRPMLERAKPEGWIGYGERKLAFDENLNPTGYFDRDVWFRTVIDWLIVKDRRAVVMDWKTGKRFRDTTQLQLSAITVASVHDVDTIDAALVFTQHGTIERASYAAADRDALMGGIAPRVNKMRAAVETRVFDRTPSGICKQYCLVRDCPFYGRGSRR